MVIKREVLFTPADQARTLHIWLPDDYEETDERYPVMYFFDGHNLFYDSDATYGKSWGLKDFLERWEKKIIVVGIECSHEGNNRLVEYSPYHIVNKFFGDLRGTGRETMRWMAEELKPMIDREYRTYPFREATAIGGSSMGGLMSVYAAIAHNDVFSKAACLSSAIGSSQKDILADFAKSPIDPDTRVYLSWGEKEGHNLRVQYRTAAEFEKRGATVRLYEQPEGRHCEADWEKQIGRFMDFLWLDK